MKTRWLKAIKEWWSKIKLGIKGQAPPEIKLGKISLQVVCRKVA